MLEKKATNRIVLVSFVCFPVYVAISDEGFANIFANAISPTPNSTNNNHVHVHSAYLKFFVCFEDKILTKNFRTEIFFKDEIIFQQYLFNTWK